MAYGEQDPRRLIVRLAVAVMIADGRITATECDAMAYLDRLGLGPLSTLVDEEVGRASRHPIDLIDTCEGLADASPQAAAVILTLLAEIAAADGSVSEQELATFDTVAKQLGLSSIESDHILDLAVSSHGARLLRGADAASAAAKLTVPPAPEPHRPPPRNGSGVSSAAPDLKRARRILGVTPDADREQVDRAYMALVQRYDPTQLAALGPEFAALAVRKLAEATAAFQALRRVLRAEA